MKNSEFINAVEILSKGLSDINKWCPKEYIKPIQMLVEHCQPSELSEQVIKRTVYICPCCKEPLSGFNDFCPKCGKGIKVVDKYG